MPEAKIASESLMNRTILVVDDKARLRAMAPRFMALYDGARTGDR